MNCKFCGQNRKLIKAHIIPECFWASSGKKSSSQYLVASLGPEFPKRRPVGVYDKKLVCIECEKLWNDYDSYACELLVNNFDKDFEQRGDSGFSWYEKSDYDYDKLKLFFISLLWRASASNVELFQEVIIESRLDDDLKNHIRNKNPGPPQKYSVVFLRSKDFLGEKSIFLNAKKDRLGESQIDFYKFYMGEFFVWVKVDSRPWPNSISSHELGPNRHLYIPISKNDDDLLRKAVKEMDKRNPLINEYFKKQSDESR